VNAGPRLPFAEMELRARIPALRGAMKPLQRQRIAFRHPLSLRVHLPEVELREPVILVRRELIPVHRLRIIVRRVSGGEGHAQGELGFRVRGCGAVWGGNSFQHASTVGGRGLNTRFNGPRQ
jgi:hypothetical protein